MLDDPNRLLIYVVDDDEGIRAVLRWMLEAHGMDVVCCPTAEHLLELIDPDRACCLVLDACLPGMSGVEVLRQLRSRGIGVPTILLTGYGSVRLAVEAMRAGALDVLEKPFNEATLLAAVRDAAVQAVHTRKRASENVRTAQACESLTPREHEILDYIVDGLPSREIGETLGISPRTVDVHRANIIQKVGAQSTPDLIRRIVGLRVAVEL